MRRTRVTTSLAALALLAWLTPQALAQDTKSARGTISAIAANSITVKSAGKDMVFTVDAATDVVVRGGTTASRAAASAGKPGPKLAELVKVGDGVDVRYREKGGTMLATELRVIDAAAANRPAAPAADPGAGSSNGTVQTISGKSLTIAGTTGGGGKFTQTLTIDGDTKVIAVGAGTASAARGGKVPVTEIVAPGDHVSVKYHSMGTTLHASEIRVTEKAKK